MNATITEPDHVELDRLVSDFCTSILIRANTWIIEVEPAVDFVTRLSAIGSAITGLGTWCYLNNQKSQIMEVYYIFYNVPEEIADPVESNTYVTDFITQGLLQHPKAPVDLVDLDFADERVYGYLYQKFKACKAQANTVTD